MRGLFEDSLPEFVQHYKAVPALVHVDCDLFGSTITCLKAVLPLCKPGVVVLFDEYYNYPTFEKHEWLAWRQLRAEYGIKARCIAYDGRRAAFEVISIEEGTARMHSN